MRFLSIDGGGSRGVVSLAFMEELERPLDLTYAVQEHFDFALGTSSGKLADRMY
jgi:patatin-like phospholipase/acyl hydrolase